MTDRKPVLDIIYDEECYPNFWSLMASPANGDIHYYFEISPRRNDIFELLNFTEWLIYHNYRMVGYNNVEYDYPVLHYILMMMRCRTVTNMCLFTWEHLTQHIYQKSNGMFDMSRQEKFEKTIWPNQRLIPQLDLMKIHHFDSPGKWTTLKYLEINMRLHSVEDLPFPPGTVLTLEQMPVLFDYHKHDIFATKRFYHHSIKQIKFRDDLSKKHGRDFTNYNDPKIGETIIMMELEKRLGKNACRENGRPKQTIRGKLKLGELIFPYVKFRTPQFNKILEFFHGTETSETKGVFKNLSCDIDGLICKFGMGGIHAFRKPTHAKSCQEYAIVDVDVESYYGSLSVANKLFPAHLSEVFCDVISDIKIERKQYEKGTAENKGFKLSINGAWGKSNDKWSSFFDSKYAMKVTINGQLLLCMLAEMMMAIPDTTILQMNTDGLTVKIPRTLEPMLDSFKKQWETLTGLNLEKIHYTDMFLLNVNSYFAIDVIGEIKRKKDFNYYELEWHKNHSMLVVPKAAEAHLTRGVNIEQFIVNHENDFDFCLAIKTKGQQKLLMNGVQVVGKASTRYYVSKSGSQLAKQYPVPKKPGETKIIRQHAGRNSTICNNGMMVRSDIDYDFYIKEVEKLTKPITG